MLIALLDSMITTRTRVVPVLLVTRERTSPPPVQLPVSSVLLEHTLQQEQANVLIVLLKHTLQ